MAPLRGSADDATRCYKYFAPDGALEDGGIVDLGGIAYPVKSISFLTRRREGAKAWASVGEILPTGFLRFPLRSIYLIILNSWLTGHW